jgi:hypothetical protein
MVDTPSPSRPTRSAVPPFLVGLGGTLFALALPFVGCSASSEPNPPQVGNCNPSGNVKCGSALSGGAPGQNSGGGAGNTDSGGGGATTDVNGPSFDGNLTLPSIG